MGFGERMTNLDNAIIQSFPTGGSFLFFGKRLFRRGLRRVMRALSKPTLKTVKYLTLYRRGLKSTPPNHPNPLARRIFAAMTRLTWRAWALSDEAANA
jgi:hypothetical protein